MVVVAGDLNLNKKINLNIPAELQVCCQNLGSFSLMISISVTIVPLVTFSYFLKCSFLLLSFLNTWSIMFLVWPSGEVHDISPMILHMYGSINLFVFSIYLITYMYVTTLLFINHQPCLAINANFSSCWDKDFNSKGRKTSRIL